VASPAPEAARLLYICRACGYVSVTGTWVKAVVCPRCQVDLGKALDLAQSRQFVRFVV
jgi:predicted Zn-ribbon and HTH transcriptional regulator